MDGAVGVIKTEQQAFELISPKERVVMSVFILLPCVQKLLGCQPLNLAPVLLQLVGFERVSISGYLLDDNR